MIRSRRKQTDAIDLDNFCQALDVMLSGADSVIGNDFILELRDPLNADIGHLDPKALKTFDQALVDELIATKALEPLVVPKNLKQLNTHYMHEREQLSEYYETTGDFMLAHDVQAAKELGSFDPYLQKVVIRNNAELNLFSDYCFLYRKIDKKRAITHWVAHHPDDINPENKAVVAALEKARFAVLRLDKDLDHGAWSLCENSKLS